VYAFLILCLTLAACYQSFLLLDLCVTARKNTTYIESNADNYLIVESIDDENLTTTDGRIYPLDFISETVYPLLPNNDMVVSTEDKCILKPLTYTEIGIKGFAILIYVILCYFMLYIINSHKSVYIIYSILLGVVAICVLSLLN
jgi:hypothetical protein